MIKFFVSTLTCFIFLSFFSLSQATPITNLSQAELDARDVVEMGISLRLVDVIYPCSEGWSLFPAFIMHARRAAQTWLLEELHVLSVPLSGK